MTLILIAEIGLAVTIALYKGEASADVLAAMTEGLKNYDGNANSAGVEAW